MMQGTKKNIAHFRLVDTVTEEVLLQTSRYGYFYSVTGGGYPEQPGVVPEAITDDGEVISLLDSHIDDGLNDFATESMGPVKLVAKDNNANGFVVVAQ